MGKNLTRLLLAAVVAALAVWAWNQLGGEERKIGARLDTLAELLSKDGEEDSLEAANTAHKVRALFAPDFEVLAEDYSLTVLDAGDLGRALYRYRSAFSTLGVSAELEEVEVAAGGASARSTAFLRTVATTGGERAGEGYLLSVDWQLHEGEWLIGRVELLEVQEILGGGLLELL